MFKKVLVPLVLDDNSFTENLDRLWFPGKLEVEHFHLLHVLCSGLGCLENTDRILENKASSFSKGNRRISYEAVEGHAASQIVTKAKAGDFDLIMIPANNKNFLAKMMLGSTTAEVIRMTDTPVLAIKPGSVNLNTVLYATDFQEAAARAVDHIRFLGRIGSELIILHVGKRAADPDSDALREEDVRQKLEQTGVLLSPYWPQISKISLLGTPSRVIAVKAKEKQADLVVLGKGNKDVMKRILGSTAEKTANSVRSSVLIVP